jgi:hypothetical protein
VLEARFKKIEEDLDEYGDDGTNSQEGDISGSEPN